MRTKLFAEFIGTFILVFAGTAAIVFNHMSKEPVPLPNVLANPAAQLNPDLLNPTQFANQVAAKLSAPANPGAITHPGIALVFGLVVLAIAYTFGDVSGAHINPAVTLGFAVARRFAWRDVPGYIIAQCLGAIAASGLLFAMFPLGKAVNFGATTPFNSAYGDECWVLEIWLTWALMLVILHVSTGAKEKGITAGIAVGAVIALEALFAGPICGASMNPARSLAPALFSGPGAARDSLWIYLSGPIIGAVLAVPTFALTRQSEKKESDGKPQSE